MTHLTDIPRFPTTTHVDGERAGRGTSSRLGPRARTAFPPLSDAPETGLDAEIDGLLSDAGKWLNRAATALQIGLVALLFAPLAYYFAGVSDALTVHPDPVEVGQ